VDNVKATLLLRQRIPFSENSFAELVIWKLPQSLSGSEHLYKYRLAFIVNDECVLRYDNEAGKGDHKHANGREAVYVFESPEQLVQDFLREVKRNHREDRSS
jgi:hypothetical protein